MSFKGGQQFWSRFSICFNSMQIGQKKSNINIVFVTTLFGGQGSR